MTLPLAFRRTALALALLPAALLQPLGAGEARAQEQPVPEIQPQAGLQVSVTDTLGQPIPGARVVVTGVAGAVRSDSAGIALVQGIPLGSRLVTIRRPGFGEERALLQFPSAALFRLPVVLSPEVVGLDTLEVLAQRFVPALHRNGFYRRREQGVGRHFGRTELDRTGSMDLAPILRRVSGFTVRPAPGRATGFILESSRGIISARRSSCTPKIFVDGVRADMELLESLSPREVEAVEAYSGLGGAPAEYTMGDAPCGVVLVWLR